MCLAPGGISGCYTITPIMPVITESSILPRWSIEKKDVQDLEEKNLDYISSGHCPKLKLFTVDAFVEITNLLVTRGNTQARGEGELKARSSATKVIGKQIWIIGKQTCKERARSKAEGADKE